VPATINPDHSHSPGFPGNFIGRFNRGIWVVTIIQLFTAAGFSICLPFLPLYLYQERGLSMTVIGTLFLIGGICTALTQVLGGMLSDKFGRRNLMIFAVATRLLLYSIMAILIWQEAPVWSIVTAFITGQSTGIMVRPAIAAMVADLSPKEKLTESYGLMRVGANVGWAAGPALGGYLVTFLPYSWLFGIAALTNLIALVLTLLFIKESFRGTSERIGLRSMYSIATDRNFLIFTGLSLLVFLTMGQLGSTLSVFTVDRIGFSTAQYGLLLTMNGIIVVVLQYPVARFIDRFRRAPGLILGSFLYGIGYLAMGWVTNMGWALSAIFVITLGEIIFSPLTLTVIGELSPEDKRGRYMGFFGLSQSLSMSLGPLFGGLLLDAFPDNSIGIWGSISLVAFMAVIGFRYWGKQQRKL